MQRREAPGVVCGSSGGPDHGALERLLAEFENTHDAICTNGGMTPIGACLRHFSRPGDRVVAARELFDPTPDRDAHGVPTRELRDEAAETCHAIEGGQQTLSNLAAYVTEILQEGAEG